LQDVSATARRSIACCANVGATGGGPVGECGYGAVGAVVGATYPESLLSFGKRSAHMVSRSRDMAAKARYVGDVVGAWMQTDWGAMENSRGAIISRMKSPSKYRQKLDTPRWQEASRPQTPGEID